DRGLGRGGGRASGGGGGGRLGRRGRRDDLRGRLDRLGLRGHGRRGRAAAGGQQGGAAGGADREQQATSGDLVGHRFLLLSTGPLCYRPARPACKSRLFRSTQIN